MVPRRGCLLCLRVLAALLGAAAEQQVNVLAQTSVQVPDQGTQSSRREADHSEVNTLTHGLSELQTTLDPSVVATPCPALTPTLHLGALPSPDPSKAPWVDRFGPRPTCDPEHARGTRCDSGGFTEDHNATDSFGSPSPGLPAHYPQGSIRRKDPVPQASPSFELRGGTTRNDNDQVHISTTIATSACRAGRMLTLSLQLRMATTALQRLMRPARSLPWTAGYGTPALRTSRQAELHSPNSTGTRH